MLTNQLHILAPANLTGSSNRALPGTSGAMQIDADRILMLPHVGVWRCDVCRRRHLRRTPNDACMVNRCSGTLVFEQEDPDNYDLQLLTDGIEMVKAKEHSAQIPADDREWLEREFKSDRGRVNTLVATPTLELGVDIGPLDSVLMRNVPPLPANYWQRAGRAGRRQRMAVNLTYARNASHDRAYFENPLKLLGGRIDPPGFNLRNDVMVRKHVHATAITVFHKLSQSGTTQERVNILDVLN
ncbi:MAG: helicase-related protein, partial [Bryobacteraceae bacterium]